MFVDENFGGFSSKSCMIDVRFLRAHQIDHHFEVWSARGRPTTNEQDKAIKIDQIIAGSIIEHELRHFNDFLLCYASIHGFWSKLQCNINASALFANIFLSDDFEIIPFPIVSWARMSHETRLNYILDALGFNLDYKRVWQPTQLTDEIKERGTRTIKRDDPNLEIDLLSVLDKQLSDIERIRKGEFYDGAPFPLVPRFANELSSLVVQCSTIVSTYGWQELEVFSETLSDSSSMNAKFFSTFLGTAHVRPK